MLKAKLTHRSTREVKMWKMALKTTHKLYILFHRWEYYIFLLVYFSRFVEKFKDKCIYFIENIKKHSFTYATPATKVSIIKYIVFEFPACLNFALTFTWQWMNQKHLFHLTSTQVFIPTGYTVVWGVLFVLFFNKFDIAIRL